MAAKEIQKILIVDDSEMNRSILADMLGDEYDILEAEDGVQAVDVLRKQAAQLSLVLLDIVMPRLDGFGVLAAMNEQGWINDVPVIMVSAETRTAQVERAYELGVTDFIMRPFDALIVRRRVVNTILLYAKQKRLIGLVEDQIYEKEQRSSLMIDILSHVVEFRNGESGLHILHVRTLTELFLGYLLQHTDAYHLTAQDITRISTASALHDIGKIAIDERILNKPGRLTPAEFSVMKTHAAIGAAMLKDLPIYQDEPLIQTAYEICRWHHERWDGRGYPDGLAGDDIPVAAQVVALADVYDALTSERVYKTAIPHETAVEMILNGQCGAFNPLLLQCLAQNADRIRTALEAESVQEMRRKRLRSLSEETLRGEGGGVSERTLRLLDYERMKYNFFAALTDEIQFEYTAAPPAVTISALGARKLGLDEITMDPLHDERFRTLLGPEVCDRCLAHVTSATPDAPDRSEEVLLHIRGEARWFRLYYRTVWSTDDPPQFTGVLGKAIDIHEGRLKLQELERRATLDPLTGLLNRASAREQIEQRLLTHPEHRFALLFFDLDHLKTANDVYGHEFGDRVLLFLAERCRRCTRGSDLACRFGGDEFLLFLEYEGDLHGIVDRIFHSLCGDCDGFTVTVSMGVAEAAVVGYDYERLCRAADQALYHAKRAGRAQYTFYDDSMKNTLTHTGADDEAPRAGGDTDAKEDPAV